MEGIQELIIGFCHHNFLISVNTRIYYTTSAGLLDNDYGGNVRGVRPAVSLKSGTEYISGDGSVTNPFVIN